MTSMSPPGGRWGLLGDVFPAKNTLTFGEIISWHRSEVLFLRSGHACVIWVSANPWLRRIRTSCWAAACWSETLRGPKTEVSSKVNIHQCCVCFTKLFFFLVARCLSWLDFMVSIGFQKKRCALEKRWKKHARSVRHKASSIYLANPQATPWDPLGWWMDDGNMSEVLDLPTWVARCCSGVERSTPYKRAWACLRTPCPRPIQ